MIFAAFDNVVCFFPFSHDHVEIISVNSELLFFKQRDSPYFPTLTLLHQCELFNLFGAIYQVYHCLFSVLISSNVNLTIQVGWSLVFLVLSHLAEMAMKAINTTGPDYHLNPEWRLIFLCRLKFCGCTNNVNQETFNTLPSFLLWVCMFVIVIYLHMSLIER